MMMVPAFIQIRMMEKVKTQFSSSEGNTEVGPEEDEEQNVDDVDDDDDLSIVGEINNSSLIPREPQSDLSVEAGQNVNNCKVAEQGTAMQQ